ncbi:membrane bound O-acyl transferase family-domain-containing protein [Mycena metata]|uniref:Membrane bound O-acyl transferase family-domain-containing protein n=1 Tax=Mycena metata TaxID=1033252 RepID=A0AAD7J5A9_9AGAR|nr:membrane bound O-acyl transferase family-domain-containing protein [Mycena metata]
MFTPYPFNPSLWGVFFALSLLPLIVKPSPYRRLFFLPIIPLTVYALLCTTGTFREDYFVGLAWLTFCCFASDYILITEVQRELRQPDSVPIENVSLLRRLRWALDLFTSPRGVGWAHEPTTVLPPHPPPGTGRARFVAHRLWKAFQYWVVLDLCNLHMFMNNMFRVDGPDWTAVGWGWRAVAAAVYLAAGSSALMLLSSFWSAASVACRLSNPEDWPPLFASPLEAWTIRRFWGRAWHQMMRRFVSTHGKYLARQMRLRPGSNTSAYVQLYTAFVMSGWVHYLGETMAFRHWQGGAFIFFLLQAVAITLEDFLIFLAKRAGFRAGSAARLVGYVWTCAWLAWSLPIWQMPLVRGGLYDKEAMPVSVLLGLWQKGGK